MATKIRLQRFGKKGQPFYHIVIADGRAPRDGKFIEKIGVYNPLTKPATIDINVDKAVNWIQNGAIPSDTVRAILSYKGILYKEHLLRGVEKGALTIETAEAKFQQWVEEKDLKIKSKISEGLLNKKNEHKSRLELEVKANEKRAEEIAAKRLKLAQKEAQKNDVAEDTVEEAPVAETEVEPVVETVVEPVAETVVEPVAETQETPEEKPAQPEA